MHPFFGTNGGSQGIKIKKFLITETGSYNPQFRRPYVVNAQDNVLNAVSERLSGTGVVTPNLFSGLAEQIIVPSTVPEKEITIPNGWGIRRLRFQMEVVINYTTGGSITEIVQGYTDVPGLSMSNHIDPNMEFIINSVLKTRSVREMTPFGEKNYFNVVDSSHVLVNKDYSGMYAINETRMRPEDIFTAMTRGAMGSVDPGSFADTRTASTDLPAFSSRANSIPSQYLSTLASSYQTSLMAPSDAEVMTPAMIYGNARTNCASASMVIDAFIRAIASLRGTVTASTFTMRELMRLDPDVVKVVCVVRPGIMEKRKTHEQGSTSHWNAADGTTHAAVILGNSVPALMMELALTGIHFRATNREIGQQCVVVIMNYNSFTDTDMAQYLQIFRNRLEKEILAGISFNNQVDYMLEMRCDLLGETWIKLSYSANPPQDFVQPSFADALLVPVVTSVPKTASDLAEQIDRVLCDVIKSDNVQVGQSNYKGGVMPSNGMGQYYNERIDNNSPVVNVHFGNPNSYDPNVIL